MLDRTASHSVKNAFINNKLKKISQKEHFKRAIESGTPHNYVAVRAGQVEYEGEEGLGFVNAAKLHADIILDQAYDLSSDELKQDVWNVFARSSSSFTRDVLTTVLHQDEAQYEALLDVIFENKAAKDHFNRLRAPLDRKHFLFD